MEDKDYLELLELEKWKEYQKSCGIKEKVKKSKDKYTCPNIIENNECCMYRCPMWKEW